MTIRFKRLTLSAVVPTKAHKMDAGFDLTATSYDYDKDNHLVNYGTGIAVEIPEGYAGFVFPRSSVYKTGLMLTNCVGVIDSGYRGEIKAKFKLSREEDLGKNIRDCIERAYIPGERIAQLVILPLANVTLEEADELSDSERGTGGYGSTGR